MIDFCVDIVVVLSKFRQQKKVKKGKKGKKVKKVKKVNSDTKKVQPPCTLPPESSTHFSFLCFRGNALTSCPNACDLYTVCNKKDITW